MNEQLIRDAGLRVTQARVAVVSALDRLAGHPTADDILAELSASGPRVSRATVFNAVDDLVAAGIAVRADAGPGAMRYELAGEPHHHFVCNHCGEVTDVDCGGTSVPCIDPGEAGMQVESAQIIFRGICTACARL